MQVNNADFSFAGIKTAVRRAIEAEAPGPATEHNLQVLAGVAVDDDSACSHNSLSQGAVEACAALSEHRFGRGHVRPRPRKLPLP